MHDNKQRFQCLEHRYSNLPSLLGFGLEKYLIEANFCGGRRINLKFCSVSISVGDIGGTHEQEPSPKRQKRLHPQGQSEAASRQIEESLWAEGYEVVAGKLYSLMYLKNTEELCSECVASHPISCPCAHILNLTSCFLPHTNSSFPLRHCNQQVLLYHL